MMKTYEEYLEQYDWVLKRLGKGRRRLLLLGLMFIIGTNLLIAITFPFGLPANIINFVIAIALISLLLYSIICLRLQYWRDSIALLFILIMPVVIEFFIVGFTLIFKSRQFLTLFLVSASLLFSVFLLLRGGQENLKRIDLSRIKRYFEENGWVLVLDWDDPLGNKWLSTWNFDAETVAKHNNRAKWIKRLEKLHYLIPGIMILLRRAFGNEEIIIGVISITFGLLFFSLIAIVLPYYLKLYPKIREWEKEKGKPILLRFAWEKEQHQNS